MSYQSISRPIYHEEVKGANSLDLDVCVLQYRESKNPHLLRVILYKLRKTFNYYLYIKTNYHDKSDLLAAYEDKLLTCIDSFDETMGAKFITYYCRCLDNTLYQIARQHSTYDLDEDKDLELNELSRRSFKSPLSLDVNVDEHDSMLSYLKAEDSYDQLEADMLLKQIRPMLDDNEFKVCQIVLSDTHKLKYREIAEEMGLTLAAIPYILKRLQKKFKNGLYHENFAHSL